jgi:hypothetical protein
LSDTFLVDNEKIRWLFIQNNSKYRFIIDFCKTQGATAVQNLRSSFCEFCGRRILLESFRYLATIENFRLNIQLAIFNLDWLRRYSVCGKWHAARWEELLPCCFRSGLSTRQRSLTSGHRDAKGQPGGGFIGVGGSPSSIIP